MAIQLASPESTGVEVLLSLRTDQFSPDELRMVAAGVAEEDMVPVTPDELRRSYASVGAYAMSETDRELAAFARQLKRSIIEVEGESVCVAEIGSVWVAPEHRGRGIGRTIVECTTDMMNIVGFIPVAVCNDKSRVLFESLGYEPFASMTNASGQARVVEVYTRRLPVGPTWFARTVAISRMREIERFQSMELLF